MQVDGGVVREFLSNCSENKKRLDYYKDWLCGEVIFVPRGQFFSTNFKFHLLLKPT